MRRSATFPARSRVSHRHPIGRLEVGPVAVAGAASAPAPPAAPGADAGTCTDVYDDTEQLDEQCQDVGNVVLLEHINLEVPDVEVARLFFGEGLGLSADPSTTAAQRGGLHVMWYNCGKQQFHIARGPGAQRLPPGSVVGLVMRDVGAVAERMEGVRQMLGDVALTYARSDTLEVVDPYGNTYAVHASLPYFPGRQGIAYLQLPCFPGTAAAIAQFYASRMGARCRVSSGSSSSSSSSSSSTPHDSRSTSTSPSTSSSRMAPTRAEVWMGPGQKLVFVEQPQLGPLSEQAVAALFDGWHLAMYVADFSRTFTALHHPNRPPFNQHPYRDKYDNLQDALRNRQFRFQDIVGPAATGDGPSVSKAGDVPSVSGVSEPGVSGTAGGGEVLLYRISHEVRSLHHPLYGRPLYGRETGFA
ncbi:hypothetical protein PLESTM_000749300 [Pleodorina starrii]|nr:hypothetical protein PLESTM_000749300 [Pleodorina starrii]